MRFLVCIILLVLISVDKSVASKSCQTCRGTDCLEENISVLDCTENVEALPFKHPSILNPKGKLQYECLDLEYFKGDTLEYIKQCVLTNDIVSFCDTLGYTFKVNKCRTESLGHKRIVRSVEAEVDNPDELLEETTTPASEVTTTPTPEVTTTPTPEVTTTPTPEVTTTPTPETTTSTTSEATTPTTSTTTEGSAGHVNSINIISLFTCLGTLLLYIL